MELFRGARRTASSPRPFQQAATDRSPEPRRATKARNRATHARRQGQPGRPRRRVSLRPTSRRRAGRTKRRTETGGETTESEQSRRREPILVPHRPAGKRLTIAAVAAAVVCSYGAAAFAGATLQPVPRRPCVGATPKLDIAATAASAITTLWTYTPDNMDSLPDRSAGYPGRRLRATSTAKYIDAIVATNKQAQVTNTTQVMGAAVESVTPTEATAIVYTNLGGHQPGVEEHPVTALPVLSVDDAAPRREVVDHPHVDGDVVRSDPAAVGQTSGHARRVPGLRTIDGRRPAAADVRDRPRRRGQRARCSATCSSPT